MEDILRKNDNEYYFEVKNENYTVHLGVLNQDNIDNIEELVGHTVSFDVIVEGVKPNARIKS